MFDIYASVAFYRILIALHLVGASVWIGGHLVLATTILPRALRNRDPSIILDFEKGFERIGSTVAPAPGGHRPFARLSLAA